MITQPDRVTQPDRTVERIPRRRRERSVVRERLLLPPRSIALLILALAAVTGCSSNRERAVAADTESASRQQRVKSVREPPPISDTHPYQINDYLIYPVRSQKVEDLAPTVQQLFQARYGPGVVVIPHVPTNKLLIYVPPYHERERAGAASARSPVSRVGRGAAVAPSTRARR